MQERANKKLEISKRGSKAAHRRMQVLAELGIEEKQAIAGNDNFGQDDEDWDVYREIQKDGFSEDEEEELAVSIGTGAGDEIAVSMGTGAGEELAVSMGICG